MQRHRSNTARAKISAKESAMNGQLRASTASAPPTIPVGKIKSFGPFGPKYEVGQALRQVDSDDWMIEVTLVETGEKTEYRLTHLIDDPEAH
jgi:hypothetical protein